MRHMAKKDSSWKRPEPRIPARYYARLAPILARDGIELEAVLRSARVSPRLFAEPDATILSSRVDRLVGRVLEASGRTDLGFEFGKWLSASAHGHVAFGMLVCETLDEALRFESRYYALLVPSFRMRYTSGADFCEMHLVPVVAMSHACLAFHLEAIGTAALRQICDLTGNRRPACRLDLSIPEPPHARRYRELRDVRTRFSADLTPSVRIRVLDDPRRYRIATADANARRLAEERCRRMLRQVAGARSTADWVAMTLREVSGPLPSLDDLAATLSLSKRTLNRHLEREGTSFRELSGRIQHELACRRLADRAASVSEVAYSLGFGDSTNFARAFRARAGCSPTEFRTRRRR